MSTKQLGNLVKIEQLRQEPPDREQFDGMIRSARIRDCPKRENFQPLTLLSILWQWRHCAGTGSGRKIGSSHFNASAIPSVSRPARRVFWVNVTIFETRPSTKEYWI